MRLRPSSVDKSSHASFVLSHAYVTARAMAGIGEALAEAMKQGEGAADKEEAIKEALTLNPTHTTT